MNGFRTLDGVGVPAVTAEQMREIDRIAVDEFGLSILQMMENAGRSLAQNVWDLIGDDRGEVAVLAGSGGNGGGGLCCARHLHNRGMRVSVLLSKEAGALRGAAAVQFAVLREAGLRVTPLSEASSAVRRAQLVVDALIGYSLAGSPRGQVAHLIALCGEHARCVLSLDVPSGLNATTGQSPGPAVQPTRTLTLALPKIGLRDIPGELYLADIGIPPELYRRVGLQASSPFGTRYWVRIER